MSKKKMKNPNQIIENKKAKFDYAFEETIEAGLMLDGWMVKALRAGRVSVAQGVYVQIIKGEAFLVGMMINPLESTAIVTPINSQPTIKLLLKKKEISHLIGKQERDGYTIVLKDLYWKRNFVKASIVVAKGKNKCDKRQTIKNREGKIEASRAMKKYI